MAFILVMSLTVCPVRIAAGFEPGVLVITGFMVLVPLDLCFVPRGMYDKSIWYGLREDENSWIWRFLFRTNGMVPKNRITNLDVRQGPVIWSPGIFPVWAQTAGYAGQAGIRIEGVGACRGAPRTGPFARASDHYRW